MNDGPLRWGILGTGGIAHEFNNLLQTICGYTKFAIEGLPAVGLRKPSNGTDCPDGSVIRGTPRC